MESVIRGRWKVDCVWFLLACFSFFGVPCICCWGFFWLTAELGMGTASRASHSRAVKAMVSSAWWSHMMIPTRGLLSSCDWLAGSQTSSRNHGITRFCFYFCFYGTLAIG